eukprot:274708_1
MASDKMEMESESEDEDIIINDENTKSNNTDNDEQIACRLQQEESRRSRHNAYYSSSHDSHHIHHINDNCNNNRNPSGRSLMSDDDMLLNECKDEDVMIQNESSFKLRYYQKDAINVLLEVNDPRMQCIMP